MKRSVFVWSLLALVTVFSAAALAADISGKWKAEVPGRDGTPREQTFNFKVEGDKLTGTVSGMRGDSEITDGKVSGDDISFTVIRKFQDREIKQQYTGKVEGNELKLKVQMGPDRTVDIVAKRATS